MTARFDRRTVAARPDLAAAHLRGQVDAATYVEGARRSVVVTAVPLRPQPRPDGGIDTELLRGETFTVYDQDNEGWSWGQAERDDYVGWLPTEALGAAETPTHQVAALRTFIYPGPDMKLPPIGTLPFGARIATSDIGPKFAAASEGYVWAAHLQTVGTTEPDFVEVAERFLGIPYLWGGKTSLGLDCSALVQAALHAAGLPCPRDTDMQEQALGEPLGPEAGLMRGDLIFWRGHVGIMRDGTTLLHANGHTMTVYSEPLAEACRRIEASTGGIVTARKRLRHAPPDRGAIS